jgi:hypothetical protein
MTKKMKLDRGLVSILMIIGIAAMCLGCGTTYRGSAGDLTMDGQPVTNNVIERDDMRLAIVYRPLYTHKKTKNFGFSGPDEALQPTIQQIVFIIEARSNSVDVGFIDVQLSAQCQEGIRPRGVTRVRDNDDIQERLAGVPKHRREVPDFDPLIELKDKEEYPTLSLIPPEEIEIDASSGLSCMAGEMMMFELIYPLPSCYEVTEPMTLVLRGVRVGGAMVDPIEIAVAKRDTKYTVED